MDPKSTYTSIKVSGESLYRERGSRFIGYAFECDSTSTFKTKLDVIRKEHHQARHFCYAYMIGEDRSVYRSNDDGEPNGTAGKPILAQILGRDMTNVGVVVVRYFGGTKLGKGGLVRAYGNAAKDAIMNAVHVDRRIMTERQIQVSIELGEKLKGRLIAMGCELLDAEYSQDLILKFKIPIDVEKSFGAYCAENGIFYSEV